MQGNKFQGVMSVRYIYDGVAAIQVAMVQF